MRVCSALKVENSKREQNLVNRRHYGKHDGPYALHSRGDRPEMLSTMEPLGECTVPGRVL